MATSTMTSYSYTNMSLVGMYQRATLWHDSQSGKVLFQSISHTTSWHGTWTEDAHSIEIKFDCLAGHRFRLDGPQLKTTLVYKSRVRGLFRGHDYRGRLIVMEYISKWSCAGSTTELEALWRAEFGAWELLPQAVRALEDEEAELVEWPARSVEEVD